MFLPFYGFAMNPFEKALDKKMAFMSYDHNQMTNRLIYFKDSRGLGVFTAPPGYGKTFTLRCFAESLNPQLHKVIYICMSTISVMDFYRQLCAELNLDTAYSKAKMVTTIKEYLYNSQHDRRLPFMLVLDEAHHLKTEILQDIKMLMNYRYDSMYPFTLILIGEPDLNRILDRGIHEALRQRIAVHYDFKGLGSEEIETYLQHKFEIAGASYREIIGEGVIAAIQAGCKGTPRLIDQIMTQALLAGSQEEKPVITSDMILWACDSLQL